MKIKSVLADHVVLAPIDPAITPGGIVIPAAHQDTIANEDKMIRDSNQFAKARVVAVHVGRKFGSHDFGEDAGLDYLTCRRCGNTAGECRVPCDVEVGSFVVYRRAEASHFELPDTEGHDPLVIVHEESCLGTVEAECVVERVINRDRDGT